MFSRMKQLSRFHVDGSPEGNSDASSSSSIVPYSRNYSNEKYQKGLQVLQLTPVWEHIIRTRQLPSDLNVSEVFDEMNERLHDPEWQVRQHALRVLVDLLIVIGDDADMYFSPLIAPLVENLGHDAPAIRKAALDSLRIYIANTNLPETIMLEILESGLEREIGGQPGPRYVIGVILSIPSLIQPVLLTSKRSFILRTVFNVMENKMLQIQYQEIVLKVLLKIREMIGEREFDATLPILMKRDFELLCKVYQLQEPGSSSNNMSSKHESHKVLNYMVEGSPTPSYSIVPSPPMSIVPSPQRFVNYPTYSRTKEKTFNVLPPELPSTSDCNRNSSNKASSFEVIDEPNTSTMHQHQHHQQHPSTSKFANNASKQQFSSCFESESFTQIDKNFNVCENGKNVPSCQRSQSMHVYNVNTEKFEDQRKYYSLDQVETTTRQKSVLMEGNNKMKFEQEYHPKVHTYNVENGGGYEQKQQKFVSNENFQQNNGANFCDAQNRDSPQKATYSHQTANQPEPASNPFGVSYTYNGGKKPRCYSATSNTPKMVETRKLRPSSHTSHVFELSSKDEDGHGKVIMETEIKLNKDTAVTMRIFETPAEESSETSSCRKDKNLCENLEFEIDLEGLDEEEKKGINVNILTPQQPPPPPPPTFFPQSSPLKQQPSRMERDVRDESDSCSTFEKQPEMEQGKVYMVPSPKPSPKREVRPTAAPVSVFPLQRESNAFEIQPEEELHVVPSRESGEPPMKTYIVKSPEHTGNRFFNPQSQEVRKSFVVQNYDDLTEDTSDDHYLKTRRVTFGGEIIKMRTPDTAAENSDSDMHVAAQQTMQQQSPDVSSDSSDLNKPLEIRIPENPIAITYKRPNTAFAAFGDMRYAPQPSIFTFPPTSSSEASSPPLRKVVNHRSKSATPHRSPRRNSLTLLEQRLSPQPAIEVTMMHDLQRSPSPSPTRLYTRRHYGSCDNIVHRNRDLAVQTSFERNVSDSFTEATQTSFEKTSSDENSNDSTPDSDCPHGNSWETLGIINAHALKNLKSPDHRLRSQGFSKLEEALKCSETLAHIQSYLPSLLKTLLSVEKHPEIIQQKQRTVTNLILRLPLENLEINFGRILTGMTKQGGPSSNMVAKSMMTRLPTAAIVTKLLSDDFLENRTSKFKENALQMIMFALTIFPSTYFDLNTCAKQAANLAMDRRKRVRQAALDVLAILGQISSSKHVMDAVAEVVRYKVDGDMFVSAVRQRLARKVLPLVGGDGEVTYALQLPVSRWQQTANSMGADIDWICAGSGSVSPTSTKKRKSEWAKSKKQPVSTSSSGQDHRMPRSNASFSTLDSISSHTGQGHSHGHNRMQSRSFPELHDTKSSHEEGPGRFIKMPTKTPINVRFPQMPDSEMEITNPYTGAVPKRRKQSPNNESTMSYQESRYSTFNPNEAKVSSPKQLKGILVKNAQPDFKEDARIPSPKRTPTTYASTNLSYRPPLSHEGTQVDDSDDSTATHIIEKSDIFHINGRPKSSIVSSGKDSVTVTSSSDPRTELKFTVEIEPVEQVTIKTPPRTPNKSQTPSPYRSTTPPRSPKTLSYVPESDETHHTDKTYVVHVSPNREVTDSSVAPSESPPKVTNMKILPPVEHYSVALHSVPSEPTISSMASIQDSYESTTDNEQYRKPPVRATKKSKQTSSGEGSRSRKKHDDSYKYGDKPEKPRDLIVSCFVQLQSSNWEEVMEGIENFVVLSKKHAEIVDANLHLMTIELGKQIKNLRSQVARAACQAAADLFQTHRKTIEPEAEELTANLLHRTSDTNKFLRNDAVRAIEVMADNLPPPKVIHILCFKGATHHNGLVKCATAKLLNTFVNKIGGEKIYSMNRETRDKLIITCANLMMEGSLETRNYTKEIFRSLSGHPNYSKILVDVIPPRIYRNIEKGLKSVR